MQWPYFQLRRSLQNLSLKEKETELRYLYHFSLTKRINAFFLEVTVNVQQIQEYIKIWDPFRDMWEVDKEMFIERYERQNPNADMFDSNIGRYSEVANNVQMQETVTAVHFIVVNSVDLKKEIIEHCIQWQEKLCKLLYKLTSERVNYIYDYMKENGEA